MSNIATFYFSFWYVFREIEPPCFNFGKMDMRMIVVYAGLSLSLAALPALAEAREVMTLQQCRDSAMANNISLKESAQKVRIAGYDRKIAIANYFPEVSASMAYMYNSRDLDLLPEKYAETLPALGTALQGSLQSCISGLLGNPAFLQMLQKNPELQQLLGSLASTDISGPVNAVGAEIRQAFNLDITNVFAGAVSVRQPVFMGGRIVNSNRMAKLAEELAATQHDAMTREVIAEVDNAYWQIVSISGKNRLARDYADLLSMMQHDTEALVAEGLATEADLLSVKVKKNEADMLLVKTTNGLALSKMLLCKICGMSIDPDIVLADENPDAIPLPEMCPRNSDDEIFAARPEIRSLSLASRIYDTKINVARASMMPEVALTASYFLSDPNVFHGFRNDFDGMFNVGIAVKVPIVHGREAAQKVRKAKAEAVLADFRLEEAKESVALQVASLRMQETESADKVEMTGKSLASAEENLRTATAGYTEGLIPANVLMEAQTAWVKAHSEYIDACTELQLNAVNLAIAQGQNPYVHER